MNKYAILATPGHNRVYFETSKKLSLSELSVALCNCSVSCTNIKEEYIEKVFYVTFESKEPLADGDVLIISKLSFLYALFLVEKIEEKKYLLPIAKADYAYMDQNISSILKYTGKTNELFTRMMIQVGVNSSKFPHEQIKLLDPIAGKGTSLYEGLICGYDVYGVEIGDKVANEAYVYMRKYLETERYKHETRTEKVSGENKSFTSKRFIIDMAKTKEELKQKVSKHWELVSGNSVYVEKYFKKNTFHVIVGDLPYGVQHGNVTNEKQSNITRNPKELLNVCLKGWHTVLKQGGALVLGWNNFVLPREEFTEILEKYGFKVLNDGAYLEFEHRVDQAIRRDIIVAVKK